MATIEEAMLDVKVKNFYENVTKKPVHLFLNRPPGYLFKKIDDRPFQCHITGKKIEDYGYYLPFTLRVYSTKEMAMEDMKKEMEECNLKSLEGKMYYEKCSLKKLMQLRENFLLVER